MTHILFKAQEKDYFSQAKRYEKPRFVPMPFSTQMVQALLKGEKTQTRRILKPQPKMQNGQKIKVLNKWFFISNDKSDYIKQPIAKGDIIWVRETFDKWDIGGASDIIYKADIADKIIINSTKWKPSIFMKKEYCRIWLKVKAVTIEQLNDISDSDSLKEGIINYRNGYFIDYTGTVDFVKSAKLSYASLWEKINGIGSWDINPFVWVYDFERLNECPSDF